MPGFSRPRSCAWLMVIVDSRSKIELGFEQDSAAEGDLVGSIELAGGAGLDGHAKARSEVPSLTQREFRGQADRAVIGVSGRIDGGEHIGLHLRPPQAEEPAAPIAELHVHAALDSAEVGRQLDVVNVKAAEQFAGMRGSRRCSRDRRAGQDCSCSQGRSPGFGTAAINVPFNEWCPNRQPATPEPRHWATAGSRC